MHIKLGTRGSALAVAQAQEVVDALSGLASTEVIKIKTSGDLIIDRPLADIGGKALFCKELELALLHKNIDIAVHSAKDIPAILPNGLIIAGYLPRQDPRDILISKGDLSSCKTIATDSLRRRAQLLRINNDFILTPIRGNILTRIDKLYRSEGETAIDGIILAAAGINRLNITQVITKYFSVAEMLPAGGQGAIAIECRQDDNRVIELIKQINHSLTDLCVTAEREFLCALDGDCYTPAAALVEQISPDLFSLNFMLADQQLRCLYHYSRCSQVELNEHSIRAGLALKVAANR